MNLRKTEGAERTNSTSAISNWTEILNRSDFAKILGDYFTVISIKQTQFTQGIYQPPLTSSRVESTLQTRIEAVVRERPREELRQQSAQANFTLMPHVFSTSLIIIIIVTITITINITITITIIIIIVVIVVVVVAIIIIKLYFSRVTLVSLNQESFEGKSSFLIGSRNVSKINMISWFQINLDERAKMYKTSIHEDINNFRLVIV